MEGIQPFKVLNQIVDFATARQCACKACAMARRYKNACQESKVTALRKELVKNMEGRDVDQKIFKSLKEQVDQDAEQTVLKNQSGS